MAEAAQKSHRHQLARLGIEQQQRAVQVGMAAGRSQQLIGAGARVAELHHIVGVQAVMLVARLAADGIDGARARHAQQPGHGPATRRIKARRLAPDLEVGLLHHLLGHCRAAHHAQHHAVDPRQGGVVERRQRALVMVGDGIDPGRQPGIVQRHGAGGPGAAGTGRLGIRQQFMVRAVCQAPVVACGVVRCLGVEQVGARRQGLRVGLGAIRASILPAGQGLTAVHLKVSSAEGESAEGDHGVAGRRGG